MGFCFRALTEDNRTKRFKIKQMLISSPKATSSRIPPGCGNSVGKSANQGQWKHILEFRHWSNEGKELKAGCIPESLWSSLLLWRSYQDWLRVLESDYLC